jgi:hypothetical protein
MPDSKGTTYQTSDGKQFVSDGLTNRAMYDAEDHQHSIDSAGSGGGGSRPRRGLSWAEAKEVQDKIRSETLDVANEIVSCYNRGDWDSVIRLYEKNTGLQSVVGAFYCVICAYAKKGHYERVLDLCFDYHWMARQGNYNQYNSIDDIQKEAWQKVYGHPMTNTDQRQFYLNKITLYENKNLVKMTDEQKERIIGAPLPKGKRSSTSTTSGGSILFCIIGAIVVAIIGFSILGWLGLIGGAVGGFFIGKWLGAKVIGKILLIVALVVIGGGFIISKLPSKPAAATTETTATEE